jgi:hypothetical protein
LTILERLRALLDQLRREYSELAVSFTWHDLETIW